MPLKLADAAVYIGTVTDGLKSGLTDAENKTKGFSERAGGLLKGALVGGAVAAAGAIVAIGTAAWNTAAEVEGATADMKGALGLSDEEAAAYEETMRNIYTNNFGADYADVAAGLSDVHLQLQRIGGPENQEQLQKMTENAFSLADAFDIDVNEATAAAVTLMDNFGLSSDEAFDFIASGFQNGLNASDDFLDSIGEYSGQFSNMGADAGEFYSIMETGAASGVLGTDKIADAFKEFNIRVLDDSDSTKNALESIGISYDELTQGFADGSITQMDASSMVIAKLWEIADPIARNTAGVALFGTQWEDLTEDVIAQVDSQKTKIGELEGAMASVDEQYNTTQAQWETNTRLMKDALVPLGEALMSIANEMMPSINTYIRDTLTPAMESFGQSLQTTIDRANEVGWGQALGEGVRQHFVNQSVGYEDSVEEFMSRTPGQQITDEEDILLGVKNFFRGLVGGSNGITVNNTFYGNSDPAAQQRAIEEALSGRGVR